jgi:hypothetical protein
MKTLLLTLLLCLVNATSFAIDKSVEIIVPTKTSGTGYDIAVELKPLLEKRGYIVNLVMSGTCTKAQSDFYSTSKQSTLLLFNAWSALPECDKSIPTNASWVANLVTGPAMICGKPGKDNLGIIKRKEVVTIASTSVYAPSIVKSLNPNFKYVPYPESGGTVRGFTAGDTEFIITNMIRSTKLMKDGIADCFVVTGREAINGVQPATKLFPQWKYNLLELNLALMQRNMPRDIAEQFTKDIRELLVTPEWRAFADRNGYTINQTMTSDQYNNSLLLWGRD